MGFVGCSGWTGLLEVVAVAISMVREGRDRVCLLGGDTTSLALESESEMLSPRILC